MDTKAKIIAVLVIFIVLIAGGVFLVVMQEPMTGSNMITAGISFVTGAGIMIINNGNGRHRKDSLPPTFRGEGK